MIFETELRPAQFKRELAFAELVLEKLKTAATREGLLSELLVQTDESYDRVPLAQCFTRATAPQGAPLAFRATQWKGLPRGEHLRVGPESLRLLSANRLAWGAHIPAVLSSLNGLPVQVTFSRRWKEASESLRENGGITYFPVYEALVVFAAPETEFDSEKCRLNLLSGHCMAEHPLADKSLIEWQQDIQAVLRFEQYYWERDGFVVTTPTKKAAEELIASTLSNFSCRVARNPQTGRIRSWDVHVDLTVAP